MLNPTKRTQRKDIELNIVAQALDNPYMIVVCMLLWLQSRSSLRLMKYSMHSIFLMVP